MPHFILFSIINNYHTLYCYQNLLYSISNYITDFYDKISNIADSDSSNFDLKYLINSKKYIENLEGLINELTFTFVKFTEGKKFYDLKHEFIIVTLNKDVNYAESRSPSLLNVFINKVKIFLQNDQFDEDKNGDVKDNSYEILNSQKKFKNRKTPSCKNDKDMILFFSESRQTNIPDMAMNNCNELINTEASYNDLNNNFFHLNLFNSQQQNLINNVSNVNTVSVGDEIPFNFMNIPRSTLNNNGTGNCISLGDDPDSQAENFNEKNSRSILGKRYNTKK